MLPHPDPTQPLFITPGGRGVLSAHRSKILLDQTSFLLCISVLVLCVSVLWWIGALESVESVWPLEMAPAGPNCRSWMSFDLSEASADQMAFSFLVLTLHYVVVPFQDNKVCLYLLLSSCAGVVLSLSSCLRCDSVCCSLWLWGPYRRWSQFQERREVSNHQQHVSLRPETSSKIKMEN